MLLPLASVILPALPSFPLALSLMLLLFACVCLIDCFKGRVKEMQKIEEFKKRNNRTDRVFGDFQNEGAVRLCIGFLIWEEYLMGGRG